MKKLFGFAVAAVMMAACQNPSGFTINGTVENANDGDTVKLQLVNERQLTPYADAVVANGKFTFKGVADSCELAYLTVGDKNCQLFLESGEIKVDMKDGQQSTATGTPNNNALEEFMNDMKALDDEYAQLNNKMNDSATTVEEKEELEEKMKTFEEHYYDVLKNSVKNNTANMFGIFNLQSTYYYFEAEELQSVLEKFAKNFPNNVIVKDMLEKNKVALETSIGKTYKDFEMNTVEGTPAKLSDFVSKNKVTLIDFWASWCSPCRAEMPNVKAAYDAFKEKGFGIVGISLDNNGEAWKKAIADLGLEWPQLSDLQGWKCAGAQLYAISSIPATLLVGQDGIILAKNLRGEELQQKLAELLQ